MRLDRRPSDPANHDVVVTRHGWTVHPDGLYQPGAALSLLPEIEMANFRLGG
jgi:hypothetical protein